MIRIETPVVCQNGHRATWVAEYSGYDCVHRGVSDEENCKCPKGERGQGWFVAGEARVVSPVCGRCALVDAVCRWPAEEFTVRVLQTQEEVDEVMAADPELRVKVGDTLRERVPPKFVVREL